MVGDRDRPDHEVKRTSAMNKNLLGTPPVTNLHNGIAGESAIRTPDVRKPNKSVHTDKLPNTNVLSLEQLRAEGKVDAERIAEHEKTVKKHRKASLTGWFRQSKRLWIAAEEHHLKGVAFVKFAADIRVDRSTAYELVKLYPHCAKLVAKFEKEEAAHGSTYEWPSLPDVLLMIGHAGASADTQVGGKDAAGKLTVAELCKELEATRKQLRQGRASQKKMAPKVQALEAKKAVRYGIFGKGDPERATPDQIFDRYDREFHFTLDVAATTKNAKCKQFFTKRQDGLKQPWHGNVWLNPPYDNIGPWAAKAWEYSSSGEGIVVALLPIWPGTAWYQTYAIHGHMRQLTSRISFVGSKANAPFDCMIVVWTKTSQYENGRLYVTMEDLPPNPAKTANGRKARTPK